MQLHNLPKTTARKKKRVGRGYGSGKGGHTVGRGSKGQKSRYSIPLWFTGTSWVWFKRLPFVKGKNRFKSVQNATLTLTLSQLDKLKAGSIVNLDSLVKQGLLTTNQVSSYNIKVLGNGKLTKKLKVALPASKSAIKAIKKAGGEYLSEAS